MTDRNDSKLVAPTAEAAAADPSFSRFTVNMLRAAMGFDEPPTNIFFTSLPCAGHAKPVFRDTIDVECRCVDEVGGNAPLLTASEPGHSTTAQPLKKLGQHDG